MDFTAIGQSLLKCRYMKRLFFALALLGIFSSNILPQTPSVSHQAIKTAVENRDYPAAIKELDQLAKSSRTVFEANNYDYLLGRMAEKSGDFAKAMSAYQSVVKRNSVLKPYALWHLSQVARSTGNLLLERVNLQELIATGSGSLLEPAAKNRLARSLAESKNYDEAIAMLSRPNMSGSGKPGDKSPDNRILRDNLALLGRSYLYAGNAAKARESFAALIDNQANPAQPDDYALAAVKGLDILDGWIEGSETAPKLSDPEHVRRARIYQFNRDFKDARMHYRAVIENYPASENVPDATYNTGRCHTLDGNFAEAVTWYERVMKNFPDHPLTRDAFLQAASAYSRLNKGDRSIELYQQFIDKFPQEERLARAYLNAIDVLRYQGKTGEALNWAARTQESFKGKLAEALALFSQARIRLAASDWAAAIPDLDRLLTLPDLGGNRVAGGTSTQEVTFLKAFALEQMERYPEAIDTYLSLPDGRNEYYGWQATEKMKAMAANEKTAAVITQKLNAAIAASESKDAETQRKSAQMALRLTTDPEIRTRMLEVLKKAYSQLPAYQNVPSFKLLEFGRKEVLNKSASATSENAHRSLADELLFLGLFDEGTPELEASKAGQPGTSADAPQTPSRDYAYTLAVLFRRGDMANRAVAFAEPLWRSVPADYQIELLPRDQVELLYPAPYKDALLKYGPERNVDPRYLLSIMRVESRYRADVKSYAAARGLMQFISSTSDKIAAGLGRKNFRQDDLYDPSTAILFGAQYLADIYQLFPGQMQAVSASYNGGEENMKRWLVRSNSDLPERYVPEVAFSQSKDYVYKVMASYRVYSAFYDENLRPK